MRLLLDTHVLVWGAIDPDRIPPRILELIRAGECYASDVSPWEVAIRLSTGRLTLDCDFREWLAESGFYRLRITLDHVWSVKDLPPHHGDPFDRLLVAQARAEGLTLISADAHLLEYDVPVLWR